MDELSRLTEFESLQIENLAQMMGFRLFLRTILFLVPHLPAMIIRPPEIGGI